MSDKKLMSLDDMFGEETSTCQETGIVEIEIQKLVSFHEHPFRLYEGQRLQDMIQSIKAFGVITPIIVRQKNDGLFEILSGHNRVNAAWHSGIKKVPAVVKQGLTEEEAILIVTETNMMQRSFTDLSHSERATIIATRHRAMTSQGVRSDLLDEIEKLSNSEIIKVMDTFSPMGKKYSTHKLIGETYNMSKNSIARYLRIAKLNDDLKCLVDAEQLSIRAAVDISYLNEEEQDQLALIANVRKIKVDMEIAKNLRMEAKHGELSSDKMTDILLSKMQTQKSKLKQRNFKLESKLIEKYFSSEVNMEHIEEVIDEALSMYFNLTSK